MSGNQILRTYKVALGRNPRGPKLRKGDHKTPEGLYTIDAKREHSRFYRALHISYPNTEDENGRKQTVMIPVAMWRSMESRTA